MRPWLALYPDGVSADPAIEHPDALAMFEGTVLAQPSAPALWYFRTPMTFRKLDESSSALAAAFLDRGVVDGDRVAAQLQNIPQMIITTLAAWKAGAVLVPVSAMLKGEELAHVLSDSGSVVLVTLESLWRAVAQPVVGRTHVDMVVTTSELDFLSEEEHPRILDGVERDPSETLDLCELIREYASRTIPRPTLRGDWPALLTYTSGTTGPAKAAINTHRNVVFNSQTYRDWVPLTGDDVILGIAPLSHVTGLIGHMTASFLTGAPLVLAYRFEASTLLELIEYHRATFTVGAITAFVAMMNAQSAGHHDVSSLTRILSGGAPVAPSLADEVERHFGAPLRNIYGLTETTSPSHIVPPGRRAPVDPQSGALSVGVPVSGTIARIIGVDGRDVPAGTLGEIEIAGPQVVPGYWQKPEESEHALPAGALRTGDIGFMDSDGWFYVVDRLKDQINASGFKVWPREVEDVLVAHPAVLEAAVVGVADVYRGETVKAYVALCVGHEVGEAELIAFCKVRLAAYKCPRIVEFVDELPKNANAKVLRRELRDRG